MSMTYAQLADKISKLTDEQKEKDVTVLVGDEFLPMNAFDIQKDDDILDNGHPYLLFY